MLVQQPAVPSLCVFRAVIVVWAALSVFAVSGCGSSSCGCGSSTDAPLSEHNLAYAGEHTVDTRCVCRCGDGPPFEYPADRPCDDYETACAGSARSVTHLRCN